MPSHFEDCTNLLRDSFQDEWWKTYSFDDEILPDEQKDRFEVYIDGLRTALFDKLNYSLLKGEYISVSEFEARLKELQSELNNISFFPPSEAAQAFLLKSLKEEFIDLLTTALDLFANFYKNVTRKLSLNHREYFFEVNHTLDTKIEEINRKLPTEERELLFFETNLKLAFFDYFLHSSKNSISVLLNISQKLSTTLAFKPYSNLLRSKCDFIFSKLVLRTQLIKSQPLFYVKDFEERPLLADEFINPIFREWFQYATSHYEIISDWKDKVRIDFDRLKKKKVDDLQFLEVHRLIKYYKDVNKNLLKLSEIRIAVQNKWANFDNSQAESQFDYYSLSIILNYSINNEFSLLCESKDGDVHKNIEELYREIVNIQESTGIQNFFPEHKYLHFLTSELASYYNKKEVLSNSKEIRSKIDKCKELIQRYEDSISWSSQNYNYVFQLPFKECFVKTDNAQLVDIFVSSSFMLPLVKSKYINDFEDFKKTVFVLDRSIEIVENVETKINEFDVLKADIRMYRDESKDREIKSIEIIGVFTALVTFIAASIPTFKFILTIHQAALFLLTLSSSLCLFLLTLILLIRGFGTIRKYWLFWLILLFIAGNYWIALYRYTPVHSVQIPATKGNVRDSISSGLQAKKPVSLK